MVGAYGTFVNRGVHTEPIFVTRIEDRQCNVLASFTPQTSDVISEQTAYTMLGMLQNVVTSGTAGRLKWMYGFDGEIVMGGREHVKNVLTDYNKRRNEISQKEADVADALMLVNEYFQRGYEFLPVDIRKSHATKYIPEGGRIRLPFTSLPGLGEKAAISIMNAMKAGDIFSLEDLRGRAKISKSVVELLEKNGALKGMSKTNQLSLFG